MYVYTYAPCGMLNIIKSVFEASFEGDRVFYESLKHSFDEVKQRIEKMQARINLNNEQKTGNFFTSYFNKKDHIIPDIEIPESISDLGEESEEEQDVIGTIDEE